MLTIWKALEVQSLRFDRNFQLVVGLEDQALIIEPELRIAFSGQKSITGGLNKLTVSIYNLNKANRLRLVKDPTDPTDQKSKYIPIQLKVGYGNKLNTVFKGSVHRGYSERQGADILSKLECLDGGFDAISSFTSKTIVGKDDALGAIIGDMANTKPGKITKQQALIRPKVLVGNSFQLIEQTIGEDEDFYIDDEAIYIIKKDEIISTFVPVVNSETGLIGTPTRDQGKVTYKTFMNPELNLAGLCKLESEIAPDLNDIYKIDTIGYDGDYMGADWSMTPTCRKSDKFVTVRK